MRFLIAIVLFASLATGADAENAGESEILLGAIRWDAWHGPASNVGLTVEKTLAPAHWHHRLPFFGR